MNVHVMIRTLINFHIACLYRLQTVKILEQAHPCHIWINKAVLVKRIAHKCNEIRMVEPGSKRNKAMVCDIGWQVNLPC